MVLLKDGTLRAWGNSDWGQIGASVSGTFQPRPQTPKIAGVKAFFLGGNHSFAIRNDGSLWIWGSEAQGEGLLAKNQCRCSSRWTCSLRRADGGDYRRRAFRNSSPSRRPRSYTDWIPSGLV